MKRILLILFMLMPLHRLSAQDKALLEMAPCYFLNTDLVSDVVSIPTLGCEKLFVHHSRLKSLKAEVAYQIHNNNQFGIATSHGDKISVGVYQGPVAKFGYNLYSHRHRKKWSNYYSPGLVFKYLWYDNERVNLEKMAPSVAYRMQSEQCFAAIPQFTIGAKRTNKHFCADFYCGLQIPVKFRYKTILYEQNEQGIENLHVPYNTNQVMVFPSPLLGIKLGYITKKEGRKVSAH